MPRQGAYSARTRGDLVVPPLSLQPRGQDFDALQQHAKIMKKNKWLSAGLPNTCRDLFGGILLIIRV